MPGQVLEVYLDEVGNPVNEDQEPVTVPKWFQDEPYVADDKPYRPMTSDAREVETHDVKTLHEMNKRDEATREADLLGTSGRKNLAGKRR